MSAAPYDQWHGAKVFSQFIEAVFPLRRITRLCADVIFGKDKGLVPRTENVFFAERAAASSRALFPGSPH